MENVTQLHEAYFMNIGFIGCGNIAHSHADVLKSLGINISAVSARKKSPNIGPFSEKYNIQSQYIQWQEMVKNEELDALWVVASWDQIDAMLIPLIETGTPLFLEKPIALSSDRIEDAIEVHNRTKQYIQVGYNRKFYPFMNELKSIIEDGELRSVLMEIPESVDLNHIDSANNLWVINSSHIIDLLIYFVGPINLKYKNNQILKENNIPSSFNAVLETEQGKPIHISAEWNTSNNFGLTFAVDDKRIVLKPLEIASIYEGFNVIEPSGTLPVRQYIPKKSAEYFCDGKFKPGFYEQAEYFLNQLNSNNFNNKHSDLLECLTTTKLIENLKEINYA